MNSPGRYASTSLMTAAFQARVHEASPREAQSLVLNATTMELPGNDRDDEVLEGFHSPPQRLAKAH